METKKCTKCGEEKPRSAYHRRSGTKIGIQPMCKECKKLRGKLRYAIKKEHILKINKRWRDDNKEYHQHLRDVYSSSDVGKKVNRAKTARYRATRLKADLGFCCKDVYSNCPKDMHVDHIVPLQGTTVCGLHVPWNLQYLTPEENRKKSNKLMEEHYVL